MKSRKERKTIRSMEENADYLAYRNSQAYALTDIPLSGRDDGAGFTPEKVWEGFDPAAEALDVVEESPNRFTFTAKHYADGPLRVDIEVFQPEYPSKRGVLIVQEYGIECQKEMVQKLVEKGFSVFVPDYCGCKEDSLTDFPDCVSYGLAGESEDHFSRVLPTPRETCNYLYTLILRRAVTFMEKHFSIKKPALIGIRNGVEYAMQTAGSDKRVRGLGCLCGAGYTEFLSNPLYVEKELTLTAEQLSWLTGVSGVSYLIGRDIPLFVGIGSNDIGSDVDRLSSLKTIVGKENLRVYICNGYSDNVTAACFENMENWLRLIFLGATMPNLPTVEIKTNSDGTLYANVFADSCTPIRSALFFYAFGDVNHQTRNWYKSTCETVGKGEYIANVPVPEENEKLFFYAHVTYENGIELSGLVRMEELSCKRLGNAQQTLENRLFAFGTDGKSFTEYNEDPILFSEGITEFTIPIGLTGAVSRVGKMILFIGDVTKSIDKSSVLQVDCYSEEKSFDITICLTDSSGHNYYATKNIYTDTAFKDVRFACSDFKDGRFYPLLSWKEAKKLTVCSKNVVIGKLLFV